MSLTNAQKTMIEKLQFFPKSKPRIAAIKRPKRRLFMVFCIIALLVYAVIKFII